MDSSNDATHGLPRYWAQTLRERPRTLVNHHRINYPPLTEHEYTRLMRLIHVILRGRPPFPRTHTMIILDTALEQIEHKGITVAQSRRLLRAIHQYFEEGSRNDLFWSIIVFKYVTDPWLFDRRLTSRSMESYFWVELPDYQPSVPYQRYTLADMEIIQRGLEQRFAPRPSPVAIPNRSGLVSFPPIMTNPVPTTILTINTTESIPVWAQGLASPVHQVVNRQLPVHQLERNVTCTICLGEQKESMVLVIPCRHGFHGSCIQRWYQSQLTCPNCRATMVELITGF